MERKQSRISGGAKITAKIDQAQFDSTLDEQKKWLISKKQNGEQKGEEKGEKLSLPNTDFRNLTIPPGVDMREADLSESDFSDMQLSGVNLSKANLIRANFQGATAEGVNFEKADLRQCNFFEADLRDSNFEKSKNLISSQFHGANLSGIKIDDHLEKFDALEFIAEYSKSLRRLLTIILLLCVYSWITIESTPVNKILLPFWNAEITPNIFYFASPIFILMLHAYMLINLQRMWEVVATLPAFFLDGRPLDRKLHPWFLNGLIRAHFRLLRRKRPPFSYLQNLIIVIIIWITPTLTIAFFWGKYLSAHDYIITLLHSFVLTISIIIGVIF